MSHVLEHPGLLWLQPADARATASARQRTILTASPPICWGPRNYDHRPFVVHRRTFRRHHKRSFGDRPVAFSLYRAHASRRTRAARLPNAPGSALRRASGRHALDLVRSRNDNLRT